jgi:hypothetical protein
MYSLQFSENRNGTTVTVVDNESEDHLAQFVLGKDPESLQLEWDCDGDLGLSAELCEAYNKALFADLVEDAALEAEIELYNQSGFTFRYGYGLEMVRHGRGQTEQTCSTYIISDLEAENLEVGKIGGEQFSYFTSVEGKRESYSRSKRYYRQELRANYLRTRGIDPIQGISDVWLAKYAPEISL